MLRCHSEVDLWPFKCKMCEFVWIFVRIHLWILVRPQWPLTFQSVHPELHLNVCAKLQDIPSRRSWDTMFKRMGQTDGQTTWCLWPMWRHKSSVLVLAFFCSWAFVFFSPVNHRTTFRFTVLLCDPSWKHCTTRPATSYFMKAKYSFADVSARKNLNTDFLLLNKLQITMFSYFVIINVHRFNSLIIRWVWYNTRVDQTDAGQHRKDLVSL